MIAIVVRVTILSVLSGSTKAIDSIATPVTQLAMMRVFLRPQYLSRTMHTRVPGNAIEW